MRDQDEIMNSTYTGEAYTSLYDAARNTAREQMQQEFRLTSNFDGPFNFVAGAAYYEDNLDFVVFGNLGFVDLVSPAGTSAALQFPNVAEIQASGQDRTSKAVYFDATYDINDRTKLTFGARHTEDEKDFYRRQYAPDGASFACSRIFLIIRMEISGGVQRILDGLRDTLILFTDRWRMGPQR